MKKLRLAILDLYDGTPNQGMRCIRQLAHRYRYDFEVEIFDVRQRAALPDLSFDVYISSGGPGHPLKGDGIWDKAYYEWLDAFYQWTEEHGPQKQLLLICHSFQMACHHFGIAEVNKRKSESFGTFPVHSTDAGLREPVFKGLDNPFYAADFRKFQVVQPNMLRIMEMDAEILALEKIRPHVPLERAIMAVRFSPAIIGVQFHPEADPEGMLEHFQQPERKKHIVEHHSLEKYTQMVAHLSDPNKIDLTYETIIPNFLEQAIDTIRVEVLEPVAV